ncbi:MAG: response regulator transcription factor [Candidatus Omnitrophota bacterium]|nr:response regulator transcription factor [Candidatus Omnitrophota bacterium]MDZ4242216.1 response regulator transcription factor [Candidatus Omnitrophota bacterium]
MRILLIEDELRIAAFIKRGLTEKKFIVDAVRDGEEGLFQAEVNPYDLILLDLMLPKKDGLAVCKELRNKKINVPILILTARDAVKDRINGLNCGADDYLSKPFAFGELLARVHALLRRNRSEKTSDLTLADLHVNMLSHDVRRAGKKIVLTTKEYALLEYFMLHSRQVVTRTMLSEHVWHEDFHSLSNVIDVHVRNLRCKVDDGSKLKLIHTIRGTGYILKD